MITAIRRRVKSARHGNDGGKIDVIIFEGMPPNNIHFEFLNPGA